MDSKKDESFFFCKINVLLHSIGLIRCLHFMVLLIAACIVMRTNKRFGEVMSTATAVVTSAFLWIIANVTVYFSSINVPEGYNKCSYTNVSLCNVLKQIINFLLSQVRFFNGINQSLVVLIIILLIASFILYTRQARSNIISNEGQQRQPDGIYNHSNQNITIHTNLRENCDKSLLRTVLVIATVLQAVHWLFYFVAEYFTNSTGTISSDDPKLASYLKFHHYHNFLNMTYIPIVCFVMNKDFRVSF